MLIFDSVFKLDRETGEIDFPALSLRLRPGMSEIEVDEMWKRSPLAERNLEEFGTGTAGEQTRRVIRVDLPRQFDEDNVSRDPDAIGFRLSIVLYFVKGKLAKLVFGSGSSWMHLWIQTNGRERYPWGTVRSSIEPKSFLSHVIIEFGRE